MRLLRLSLLSAALPVFLALAACDGDGPEDVGTTCDEDDDCAFGSCYTEAEGGYCTAECEDEGSLDQCPDGTVCKKIQGGDPRCLVICGHDDDDDDDGDCPPNAECNEVPESGGYRGCEPVD